MLEVIDASWVKSAGSRAIRQDVRDSPRAVRQARAQRPGEGLRDQGAQVRSEGNSRPVEGIKIPLKIENLGVLG